MNDQMKSVLTCKGSLNIRIKPKTHRKAAEKAALLGISLTS